MKRREEKRLRCDSFYVQVKQSPSEDQKRRDFDVTAFSPGKAVTGRRREEKRREEIWVNE